MRAFKTLKAPPIQRIQKLSSETESTEKHWNTFGVQQILNPTYTKPKHNSIDFKPKKPSNFKSPYINLKPIRPQTDQDKNREAPYRFNSSDDISIYEKYEKIVDEYESLGHFNSNCTQMSSTI